MAYQRPLGLHETTFTTGEKIIGLQRQLFLLREALVRTAFDPTFYPDLFRALRVLIIDGENGRLGELAKLVGEMYVVQSRSLTCIEARAGSAGGSESQKPAFVRTGLQSLFLPNFHSRWLALRGVQPASDKQPVSVDFWEYIGSDVIAFKTEFGAEVTRKVLIAEVCNTRDVAHAAGQYPTFLRFTNALGSTAPYFLEIAQEVSYEVLTFGRRVIGKCSQSYQDQISKALQYAIPIPPVLVCAGCHSPLVVDEFVCTHCGNPQLPPLQRYGPREQLESLFAFGRLLDMPTGSVSVSIGRSALIYDGVAEYALVDMTEGDDRMSLKRTADMKLMWRVDRNLASRSVVWDLEETPETSQVVFFFGWDLERVTIASARRCGGLWQIASDGTLRSLNE
jgi:hypothetical protein